MLTVLGLVDRRLGIGDRRKRFRLFLLDWSGEPARPGRDALPSFPERMAKLELRTAQLQHDFATETTGRLVLLAEDLVQIKEAASLNGDALARMDFRLNGVERRITDHQKRNQRQIAALRDELFARIHALGVTEAEAAAMRAVLTELGMDMEMPKPPAITDRAKQQ